MGKTAAKHILSYCRVRICTPVCLIPKSVLLIIVLVPSLVLQMRINEESLENKNSNNNLKKSANQEQNECLTSVSLLWWWHFKNGDLLFYSVLCPLFNNYSLIIIAYMRGKCQFEDNLSGMTTKESAFGLPYIISK